MIRLDVTPESAGWGFSGLRVVVLAAGEEYHCSTGGDEVVVVPLAGSVTVTADGEKAVLTGRASVFDGPTDVAYVPIEAALTLRSDAGGRFALATARAGRRLPFRYVPVAEQRIEMRGAGNCSRQVNNFATTDVLDADRIIACEVLTPGGNWSSYPPHKHDELEEIYYFEVDGGGPAYQRADGVHEVRSGDVVLIPDGWHGPSMAAPGYHLYYLNVMAGPGERAWVIEDEPEHAWVRDTWTDQEIDPRLPFGPGKGRQS
ncbi:5-deoxy-glucuronate isomerase [Actinoplanes sp. NEAU-A12]|uniref:5-deoxy-glucuronate isomerase n=1 Tax=Actinoplanes sandaracinus TaxID=3045177 RepID=A0ABT6WKX1_9ACTN|nr:5-deoxy-glucuronate isomerase [Actinoplanes sandaracinus]MDI6100379.1 5-deoxy-glucuronate isomerase [Actinoplanes sandaracinus]